MSDQRQTGVNGFAPSADSATGDPRRRTISARVHTVGCSGLRTVTVRGFRLSSGDGGDVAGFDLGPSPEEHLLAAVGSSLAQTIAHVACAHDLSLDTIDISLMAGLEPDQQMAHLAGRMTGIAAQACLTSEDAPERFTTLADDVLGTSPLATLISIPISLSMSVKPVEPKSRADDWEI